MWTPEQDAELLMMWPDHSASQIGKRMGVSRCAVIGRYHRIQRTYTGRVFPSQEKEQQFRCEKMRQRNALRASVIAELAQSIACGTPRDEAIKEAVSKGATQQSVARAIGVTRQRIHQIVVAESENAA